MASTELGPSGYSGLMNDLITPTNGVIPSDQGKSEVESVYSTSISEFRTVEQFSAAISEYVVPSNPTTTNTYIKLRGYYVAGSTYEVWVQLASASISPPSGHTLQDTAIVSTWIA